jgi:hypothetical protein
MNKYLMLSAAAVLAGTACAAAKTYCYTLGFGTAGGGSYCDSGMISWNTSTAFHGAVRSWKHLNNNCAGATSDGFGILGKTKGLGDYVTVSDDFYAKNYGIYSEQLAYSLPAKIKDGAKFLMWIAIDGSAFVANTGTLENVGTCQDGRAIGHGRTSTVAGVKALIAARRGRKG